MSQHDGVQNLEPSELSLNEMTAMGALGKEDGPG